jgi:phage I-like protein
MNDFIMYLPGGTHQISASVAGEAKTATVRVDRDACTALQQSLDAHRASGLQRPFIDFDHANAQASGWVKAFEWRDNPAGIYASIEWSDAGRQAVEGHNYRAFSPSIFIDKEGWITGAPFNMGGLVNDPAFREIAPLWCARAQIDCNNNGAEAPNNEGNRMNEQELKLRITALETENTALKAKASSLEQGQALQAKDAEIASLKTELTGLRTKLKSQQEIQAKSIVAAAVQSGRLAPQATELHAKWVKAITDNPDLAETLNGLPASTAGQTVVQPGKLDAAAAGATGDGDFMAQANSMASSLKISLIEAQRKLAGEKPQLYEEYRAKYTHK